MRPRISTAIAVSQGVGPTGQRVVPEGDLCETQGLRSASNELPKWTADGTVAVAQGRGYGGADDLHGLVVVVV
jgi:hypothetical protein